MTVPSRQQTFQKGASVIHAVATTDVVFEAADNALFNYLLYRSIDNLGSDAIHTIPMKDAMEFLRMDRVSKLEASIERLCTGSILIDYVEPPDVKRMIRAHYLSADLSRTASGMMHYAFDPILSSFLPYPKVYAAINLQHFREFRLTAAQKLYENMSLQWRKREAKWQPMIEELRLLFQTGDKYPRFDNFRTHVIEKAVAEVNMIAHFNVTVDYIRGGPGAAVSAVEFTCVPKTHQSIMQASTIQSSKPGKKPRAMDPHTVDMLDGLTYEERGGPAEITSAVFEWAREIVPEDADLNHLVTEWREINRGRVLKDADANFKAWLHIRLGQEGDPLLAEVDGDVFGALLGGRD